VALALLNVFFFSQTAGLLVSVLSRKQSGATFGAGLILLIYTLGFYILSIWLPTTRFASWAFLFDWLNPEYCVHWACTNPTGAFARKFGHYWTSLLIVHLNAWVFLALASVWLPRCWQDKPKAKVRWREQFRQWYHSGNIPRRPLLDKNPFFWLTIRNRFGSMKVWTLLIALACLLFWILSRNKLRDAGIPLFIMAILANHLVLKMSFASEAGGNLDEQRHSGALEFLLSCTPLSVKEIIAGQWLAFRRQFL